MHGNDTDISHMKMVRSISGSMMKQHQDLDLNTGVGIWAERDHRWIQTLETKPGFQLWGKPGSGFNDPEKINPDPDKITATWFFILSFKVEK